MSQWLRFIGFRPATSFAGRYDRFGDRMSDTRSRWAGGFSMFAAAMMILLGVLEAFQGLGAIINDQFFVKVGEYAFKVDITAWGWIHLILGLAIAGTGYFVITGATWARIVGIVLAGLTALANFLSLPYYPLWSIVVIALCVAAIWGLATWNPNRTDQASI